MDDFRLCCNLLRKDMKLTPDQQINFLEQLYGQYLDNMEGEDLEGFKYWQNLALCANTLLGAMTVQHHADKNHLGVGGRILDTEGMSKFNKNTKKETMDTTNKKQIDRAYELSLNLKEVLYKAQELQKYEPSRVASIAVTKIEEALLWVRQLHQSIYGE